jgi:hypothetical protein
MSHKKAENANKSNKTNSNASPDKYSYDVPYFDSIYDTKKASLSHTGVITTELSERVGVGASPADSISPTNSTKRPFESIQKKLQQAYKEKNLMLYQIQALRKQLQDNDNNSSSSNRDRRSVDSNSNSGEKLTWNRLLDANIRAGTLACVWCLKTYVSLATIV